MGADLRSLMEEAAPEGVDTAAQPREPRWMLRTRLTLEPGANGTKKLVERYGDRLICVRYRYDEERGKRVKTVELVEEEADWLPPGALYLVQIDWRETSLREKARAAGARWLPERRLWLMTGATVRALRLETRIQGTAGR